MSTLRDLMDKIIQLRKAQKEEIYKLRNTLTAIRSELREAGVFVAASLIENDDTLAYLSFTGDWQLTFNEKPIELLTEREVVQAYMMVKRLLEVVIKMTEAEITLLKRQ